mmetsp:Transcript_51378/g.107331  ORF Transcript_51378/g.107331 Transcript_51378/m.107331 type:complete len:321 (-) Transcript_51378:454-1416(-)
MVVHLVASSTWSVVPAGTKRTAGATTAPRAPAAVSFSSRPSTSFTSGWRTRPRGVESSASAIIAAPSAAASSALSDLPITTGKKSSASRAWTPGTRQAPPVTSTPFTWSRVIPAAVTASNTTCSARAKRGSHSASRSWRRSEWRKSSPGSRSSTVTTASLFALSTCLALFASFCSLVMARRSRATLGSAERSSNCTTQAVKAAPPSSSSHPTPSTCTAPAERVSPAPTGWNRTSVALVPVAPISKKSIVRLPRSVFRFKFSAAYLRATAVPSFKSDNTFRPAMRAAESRANLWEEVKYGGTVITHLEMFFPVWASALALE